MTSTDPNAPVGQPVSLSDSTLAWGEPNAPDIPYVGPNGCTLLRLAQPEGGSREVVLTTDAIRPLGNNTESFHLEPSVFDAVQGLVDAMNALGPIEGSLELLEHPNGPEARLALWNVGALAPSVAEPPVEAPAGAPADHEALWTPAWGALLLIGAPRAAGGWSATARAELGGPLSGHTEQGAWKEELRMNRLRVLAGVLDASGPLGGWGGTDLLCADGPGREGRLYVPWTQLAAWVRRVGGPPRWFKAFLAYNPPESLARIAFWNLL